MSGSPETPAPATTPNGLPIVQSITAQALVESITYGSMSFDEMAAKLGTENPAVAAIIATFADQLRQAFGDAAGKFGEHLGFVVLGALDAQANADRMSREFPLS